MAPANENPDDPRPDDPQWWTRQSASGTGPCPEPAFPTWAGSSARPSWAHIYDPVMWGRKPGPRSPAGQIDRIAARELEPEVRDPGFSLQDAGRWQYPADRADPSTNCFRRFDNPEPGLEAGRGIAGPLSLPGSPSPKTGRWGWRVTSWSCGTATSIINTAPKRCPAGPAWPVELVSDPLIGIERPQSGPVQASLAQGASDRFLWKPIHRGRNGEEADGSDG